MQILTKHKPGRGSVIGKAIFCLPIAISLLTSQNTTFASVDHKNVKLHSYLDQISENLDEKTGIINIIKKNKTGSYLDIGSGRDAISHMVKRLSGENLKHIKLIAADLEGKTLTAIAKHYPELFRSRKPSKINLSLIKMDGTEMHQLQDNSITAINASALLHEINSYVAPKTPIDRFFGESIRILKKEGFLFYRDPTLQSNPEATNSLTIRNDLAKKFVSLFLPKFLDTRLTQLRDMHGNPIKPNFHYQEKLKVIVHLVGQDKPSTFDYQGFCSTKSADIDFGRDISIIAPRRLLSEIQRHYVLFIKDVYPVGFVDSREGDNNLISKTPNKAKDTVIRFAKSLGIDYSKKLSRQDLETLTAERRKIDSLVGNGVTVNVSGQEMKDLESLLKSQGVPSALYKTGPQGMWLDAKLFTILYNRLPQQCRSENLPNDSMVWLTREGEEFYFYFTTQELMDYLKKFCKFFLKNTDKEGYSLKPVDISYAQRDLYTNLLERDMMQMDGNNAKQEFITSKTIINFQLIRQEQVMKNNV
jgi:hypothetical protein